MAEQELTRVALNLNQIVMDFWERKVTSPEPRFTAIDLRVAANKYNYGTAPASADRILRMLKKAGKVNYAVINRTKSLYLALPLEEKVTLITTIPPFPEDRIQ